MTITVFRKRNLKKLRQNQLNDIKYSSRDSQCSMIRPRQESKPQIKDVHKLKDPFSPRVFFIKAQMTNLDIELLGLRLKNTKRRVTQTCRDK